MAKFDVTKNVVVPRGEYDDMLRDGFELATLDRAYKQAQAEIKDLTQAIDVLNRDKIEEMAAPKPTAEITPRPRAELIDAIRRAYELAGADNGLHGEAAVNALTHRLFVTGTTTIRERLSRATILAALRDAGIHPLAPEPRSTGTTTEGSALSFAGDPLVLFVADPLNELRPGDTIKTTNESTPCQHFAPAPGAFLSDAEDRELVAMGREMWIAWYSKHTLGDAAPLGAITNSNTINDDGVGVWPSLYGPEVVPTITPANRALLRRVRRERAQSNAEAKEATANDNE